MCARRTKRIEKKMEKRKRDEKSAEFWTCAKETSVVVCRRTYNKNMYVWRNEQLE